MAGVPCAAPGSAPTDQTAAYPEKHRELGESTPPRRGNRRDVSRLLFGANGPFSASLMAFFRTLMVLAALLGPILPAAHGASMRRPKTIPLPGHTAPLAGLRPRCSFAWEGETVFVESNWRDPATGLAASISLQRYGLFSAVEWGAVFHNRGPKDTPVLEEVCAADFEFAGDTNSLLLHYSAGSTGEPEDFRPQVAPLLPGQMLSYVPSKPGVVPVFLPVEIVVKDKTRHDNGFASTGGHFKGNARKVIGRIVANGLLATS